MSDQKHFFADADASLQESRFVIYGGPSDHTASFRKGAALAPEAIRDASYNFETYNIDLDVDLEDIPFHDLGDIAEEPYDSFFARISEQSRMIATEDKVPMLLGGEHNVSPHALKGVLDAKAEAAKDLAIIVVDAHFDYRMEYLGDKDSHACAVRRIAELVGADKIYGVGFRSAEKQEYLDAKKDHLNWVRPEKALELGAEDFFDQVLADSGAGRIYLSIDMDGIDPSFAPGVGTPEPFGLSDVFVRDLIRLCGPYLAGMDIVELCPPADNGNTAALAAKLIREAIASAWAGTV